MNQKRKKDEEEEKDRTYTPGQEESTDETTEDEEEEEEIASQEIQSSESEDDNIHDAQSFFKDLKKSSKKKISVSNSSSVTKNKNKRKRNADVEEGKKLKKSKLETEIGIADDKNKEKDLGGKKKSVFLFNDKNVDVNLFNEAPQNIVERKIKLSNNLILQCHVIDGSEIKAAYNNDFPALTFVKKVKDGKAFQFSIPLNLGPTIQNAIQIMVTSNPQFFSGIKKFKLVGDE